MAEDPFTDVNNYLRTLDRYAKLGFHLINTAPVPGDPDPAGRVRRLGDEVIARLET